MKNCPEIEKSCRVYLGPGEKPVNYQEAEYQLTQMEVDSNFICMFHITAIDGDNYLRLDKNQIAITDRAAQRIFGTESPIGKQLVFPQKNNDEKTIVAVVKSWEGHSLYSFDILLPYYDWEPDWGRQQCNTLFRVYPNSDIKA